MVWESGGSGEEDDVQSGVELGTPLVTPCTGLCTGQGTFNYSLIPKISQELLLTQLQPWESRSCGIPTSPRGRELQAPAEPGLSPEQCPQSSVPTLSPLRGHHRPVMWG